MCERCAALEARVKELEQERDAWKHRAVRALECFEATNPPSSYLSAAESVHHGVFYAKAIGGCPVCKKPVPAPAGEGAVTCPNCEEILLWTAPVIP